MSQPLTPAHLDNLVRWHPGRTAGMYESHFFKLNLPSEQLAFWCRFTVLQRDDGPYAFEVWNIVFDVADPSRSFALKHAYDVTDVHLERQHLAIRFGGNTIEHGHSQGQLASRGHEVRWDLCWSLAEQGLRHFPQAKMYEGDFPKTKLVSPALDARFEGTLHIDGREVVVKDVAGMQGHNWGRQHAETWVWTHCNVFETPGAVFEGVTSLVRLGPVKSPPLTILHFEAPGHAPLTINSWASMFRSSGRRDGLTWRFRGEQGNRALEGWFRAPPERFVGVHYEDPTSRITNCLNSKVADGQVRLLHKDGGIWRLTELYEAKATAALEIGVKDETHGVEVHL